MASASASLPANSNFFNDLMTAVADRHGQLDIRLEHVALRLPLINESVELNGTISLTVHLRDLTDKEKQARAAKEIRLLAH